MCVFQAQTKEFIPANQNIDKETPVVSALTDAVEVTISNKQPKDRESPAKSRKQQHREQAAKEHQQISSHQQHPVITKEQQPLVAEKQEVKHKETPAVVVPQVTSAPAAVASAGAVGVNVAKDGKDTPNLNVKEEGRRNQRKEKNEGKPLVPSVAVSHDVVVEAGIPGSSPQSPAANSQENATQGKLCVSHTAL